MRPSNRFLAIALCAAVASGGVVANPVTAQAAVETTARGFAFTASPAQTGSIVAGQFDRGGRANYTYLHPASGVARLEAEIVTLVHARGRQVQFDPATVTASRSGDTMRFVSRDTAAGVDITRSYTVRGGSINVAVEVTNVGFTPTSAIVAVAQQLSSNRQNPPTYEATQSETLTITDTSGRGYTIEAAFPGTSDVGAGDSLAAAVNGRGGGNPTAQAGRWVKNLEPGESVTGKATFSVNLQPGALDTDGDGLLDEWETKGYPLADGSVLPLHRWGADPTRKDLFLQLNWMKSEWETSGCDRVNQYAPTGEELEKFLICSYKNTNSYRPSISTLRQLEQLFAQQGIALHIDAGELYKSADMVGCSERHGGKKLDHREGFFKPGESKGLALLRTRNEMLGDRVGVFRVGVIGDKKEVGDRSSGEGMVGDGAFFVAKGAGLNSQDMLRNTILHEFGHTLGLTHYGAPGRPTGVRPDQFLPDYFSAMNYLYQFGPFNFSTTEANGRGQRPETCRPYSCFDGNYSVPADWVSLQLRGNHYGTNASKRYVEVEEPQNTDPVVQNDDETVRDLTIAAADQNEGKAGFELTEGQDNGIVTLRNDNVLRGQLSNLGLDDHTFTVTATFANGASHTQTIKLPGVLKPGSTADVRIPVPNAAVLKGPKTNVTVQVRSTSGVVFDERFAVSVLDYNRDQAAKALSELERSGADQAVKDRARARLDTAHTGTPAPQVPQKSQSPQQPAPAPQPAPGNDGGSSTAGIIAIVLAVFGLLGAGAFAVSQGLIQIPNLPF